ncbi:MAG: hypothetical protein AB7F76_00065 [Parvibaculaceae bacterium]
MPERKKHTIRVPRATAHGWDGSSAGASNSRASQALDGATSSAARWVKPELVAEIAFTEMTSDGHMRHPVFNRSARGQGGA